MRILWNSSPLAGSKILTRGDIGDLKRRVSENNKYQAQVAKQLLKQIDLLHGRQGQMMTSWTEQLLPLRQG